MKISRFCMKKELVSNILKKAKEAHLLVHFLCFFWWNRGETAAAHPDCLPTQMPRHFDTRLRTKKLKNLPQATFFYAFCPLRVRLPPNIHKKAKEAHLLVHFLCFFWWNRGESNPCPKTYSHRHLRAQSLINYSLRRKASDSPSGFGSFICHAWCKA